MGDVRPCVAGPACGATAEQALYITAQHLDSGISSWDVAAIQNLLLLRKTFSKSLRLFVENHTMKDLCHVTSLPNLKELHLAPSPVNFSLLDLNLLHTVPGLTRLFLSRIGAADIRPLAQLQALQALHLDGTSVCDLMPLKDLALRTLCVASTQVKDPSPLSGMCTLEELDMSGCKLATFTSLAMLTRLKSLNLAGTKISDTSPIAGLTLETLNLHLTWPKDVSPLAQMTTLTSLDLSSCWDLKGISCLARLTRLSNLRLCGDQLSDMRALQMLPLRTLYLRKMPVRCLDMLACMHTLEELWLDHCAARSCGGLLGLSSLRVLSFANVVALADLQPIRALTLHQLDLAATSVSDLRPLSDMTTLQQLRLASCPLSDIAPLALLMGLRCLDLSYSLVSDVAPLQGLQLTQLDLCGTRVSSIQPLADMHSLLSLHTDGCPLDAMQCVC